MARRDVKQAAAAAMQRDGQMEAQLEVEDLVGYNLRRAYAVQLQRFATVFGPLGIRPVQFSILGLIYENPGMRQAELGRKLNIKRANIVTLLHELQERGLLRRGQSKTDRRSHILKLTPSGLKFTAKLLDLHRRLEDDLARSLGVRERVELLRLLKKVRRLDPEPNLDAVD